MMEEDLEANTASKEVLEKVTLSHENTQVFVVSLPHLPNPNEIIKKESVSENIPKDLSLKTELGEQKALQFKCFVKSANNGSKKSKRKRIMKMQPFTITCKICDKRFRDNYNMTRHFETKHGKGYTCVVCLLVYNTEKKLERHMKKHTSPRVRSGNGVVCSECSRVFRDKHNMKIHKCSKKKKKSECIYPDCQLQFYHITKMLKHVEEDHDSRIDTVNLTFESEDLFQGWKEEEELKSYSYYSKRSGTVDSDYVSYRCYVCQANGESYDGPRKTAKRWKRGPARLGKLCPSRMLVKEVNGKIFVKYISYHSHSRSIKNDKLPVPNSVKTYAKNLLMMGASPQQVRKSVCEGSYGGNSVIPQGGYVISNRYFFDLKKRLDNQQVSSPGEEKEKYDPVFVYKSQGQSVVVGDEELNHLAHSDDIFAIGLQTKEQCIMMKKRSHKMVCVTSAQTLSLLGFEILTLVVPDVFGNGYPVAYFLTSHTDVVTLKLLFLCLGTRCPNLKIRSIMTDDESNIFDALNSVFGNNAKHYLCHWHVQKCWEREITNHCEVYDTDLNRSLQGLLYKDNKNAFKILSDDFVNKYSDHRPDFVKYFATNYLTRPDVWAMCYRHSSPEIVANPMPYTNVNLHCEYVQNKLKAYIDNEGTSTPPTVADTALLILNIQEGHWLQYKEHLLEGTRVQSASRGKHYNGLAIKDGDVSQSSGTWYVKSQLDDTAVYTVTEMVGACSQAVCYERCCEPACKDLCGHLYKCSCSDRVDICDHIHKVHSRRLKQESSLCITSSKMKPKNIEFIVSGLSENSDKKTLNCITVIKKESEGISDDIDFVKISINEIGEDADKKKLNCITAIKKENEGIIDNIDFVKISVNEMGEHAEVLEQLSIPNKETPLNKKVIKQEKHIEKPTLRKGKHGLCKKDESCDKNEESGVAQEMQNAKNDVGIHKISQIETISNLQQPAIKIERVNDSESDVPLIKIKRLHCDDESNEKPVKCTVIKPLNEAKRSKRIRSGSVVQAAMENKRRRLEMPQKKCHVEVKETSDDLLVSVKKELEELKCKQCDGTFRDKFNLDRHIQNKHSTPFACAHCSAVFRTKLRYEKHVKKHDGIKSTRSVQCAKCLRMFRDLHNMKQHCCDKARKQSSCIYPECGKQFYHMTQMVKHLEEDHEDKVDCLELHFESEKLFLAWKEEEEAKCLAVFNKRNGTLGSDSVKYSYYICQAGGETPKTGNKTPRQWGTKVRTGKVCPSRMLVKEMDGKISVKYISFHSHDVKEDYKTYPPLPKYVKELGKQLLLMGVSPKRVRESVQDGVLLNTSKVSQKRYAVKSRYFYDMKKRLERKGHTFPSETEKSDITDTCDNWKPKDFMELITRGKHKSYDPLLIYKAQGQPIANEDEELASMPFSSKLFALGLQTRDQNDMMKAGCCKVLCIRSYFDVTSDGFQLLNLAVPDRYGNGYPIAHFITNYVNESTLTFLFKILKKRCPLLEVQALITDDDVCIYNAVRAVFGDVHHYLCHWYVKSCWMEKIEQLVENQDQRVDIPFHLMDILYEREETKFQMLCRHFVDIYSSPCPNFMKYFVDFYLDKPEIWAMCYRQNLDGITYSEPFSNVNIHCECLHNHLKTLNLGGKFSQRVADLTKLLLKVEKEYSMLYRKNVPFSVSIHCSALARHYSGLEIEDDKVFNIGDGTWTVASRFECSLNYTVSVLEKNCNRLNCYEKCMEFLCLGLCNHLYSCSCEDRADLCEHIHKVHSLKLRLERPSDVETLTGEKIGSIQVIVHECLENDSTFSNQLRVELEPFSTLDPYDDKDVVYHEICELDM